MTYEDFQSYGRQLTMQIDLAELCEDWQKVDGLLRQKDRINRQFREARCREM